MGMETLIGAGVSLLGSAMNDKASNSAANTQAQSAQAANDLQWKMYNQSRQDQLPWMTRGNAAGDRLNYLMGLGGSGYGSSTQPQTRDQIRNSLIGQYTTITNSNPVDTPYAWMTDPLGGTVWRPNTDYGRAGGFQLLPGQNLAQGQLQSQVDEAGLNAAIDARMAQQAQEQQNALNAAQGDPAFGSLMRNFTLQDMQNDPVYSSGFQFGMDEGLKGLQRQQAASGSQLSGATLKALTRYGNDYATTKGEGAYNRFNNNQNNQYNRLAGISGTGQVASNQLGSNALSTGQYLGGNIMGAGNAQAAGTLRGASAWGNGLANAYNGYQQNQFMNRLRNPYGENLSNLSGSDFGGYDSSYNQNTMDAFTSGGGF